MRHFSIIVAATASTFGIGKLGELPWKLAGDMAFFKKQTISTDVKKKNVVIMGRKTWESLPVKFRPLINRINVVLSRNLAVREELNLPESVIVATSLNAALLTLDSDEMKNIIDQIYIIGGESIYREAMASSFCSKIYLTQVDTVVPDLDTFFPFIPAHKYKQVLRSPPITDKGIQYRFTEYDAIPQEDEYQNLEEKQYLHIVRDIITNGVLRGDRTGTGTLSKFGVQMRFNLRNGVFPLLTTKKVCVSRF